MSLFRQNLLTQIKITTNEVIVIFFLLWQVIYSQNIQCKFCKENIKNQYISVDKSKYHKQCYKDYVQPKCDICKKPIEGVYNIEGNKKYHKNCYENFILPKCEVCTQPIKTTYIIDKWDNKYHKSHKSKLPNCESCNRIICKRITNGGYNIGKDRSICSLCEPFLVDKNKLVNKYAKEVKRELYKVGFKNLPKNIPISLVSSRKQLKKLSKIRHINLSGYTHYEYETLNGKITKENYHIYILSNLHEIEFKSVLAHEFLHVYLFQKKYKLSPEYREGFCNLGSQLIYENDNSKYSDLKIDAMYENPDPLYGLGFKKMNYVLKQNGWAELLRDLSKF